MIDFKKVKTYPISKRKNKFNLKMMLPLDSDISYDIVNLDLIAKDIIAARKRKGEVIVMIGGAVIKTGCSALLIDLMKKGYITHLAGNGSISIHDFEVALIGETSENVADGLENGTFGMAEETGSMINGAINNGYKDGLGYGLSVAKMIEENDLPNKEYSLLYNANKLGIPVTIHSAIGGDIIHQHPLCSGAALGETSFKDFNLLAETISKLKGGVVLNIGSAVNLPEVFLKALTVVRNLGYDASEFTTANFDFINMYRARTRIVEWPKVLGCTGYDIREGHDKTVPMLHKMIMSESNK